MSTNIKIPKTARAITAAGFLTVGTMAGAAAVAPPAHASSWKQLCLYSLPAWTNSTVIEITGSESGHELTVAQYAHGSDMCFSGHWWQGTVLVADVGDGTPFHTYVGGGVCWINSSTPGSWSWCAP